MYRIIVDIPTQALLLYNNEQLVQRYLISTAKKGVGKQKGSEQTPRGRHIIRAKIAGDYVKDAVFVSRRLTGEIYSEALSRQYPERDWVLTGIFWLSGLEAGRNRLGNVDTMQRYIYIHGTPDSEPMGIPASHGCIRMRGKDMLELLHLVPVGTQVDILNQL